MHIVSNNYNHLKLSLYQHVLLANSPFLKKGHSFMRPVTMITGEHFGDINNAHLIDNVDRHTSASWVI